MTDQRLVRDWFGDWSGDWIETVLSSLFKKINTVFGKNKTISVQVAIMIIYLIKLYMFCLQQNRMLQL